MTKQKPSILDNESDYNMLKSCYTYGYKNSTYYNNLVKKYGKKHIEKEYDILSEIYTIDIGTYTDSEGCVYNTLVAI